MKEDGLKFCQSYTRQTNSCVRKGRLSI